MNVVQIEEPELRIASLAPGCLHLRDDLAHIFAHQTTLGNVLFGSHTVSLARHGISEYVQAIEDPTSLQSLTRTCPIGPSVQISNRSETFLVKGCKFDL